MRAQHVECLAPQQGRWHGVQGTEFEYEYRCGQCDSCRVERRERWAARILLEAALHPENCFVTLTYDDYHLPEDESVSPVEVQEWIRRLRTMTATPIRYFAVGEYGEFFQRPHYHAVIFGLPWSSADLIQASWINVRDKQKPALGFTSTYELTASRARYVARYTVKKLSDGSVPLNRETGEVLAPEFALMSRRPGIGAKALDHFLEAGSIHGVSFETIASRAGGSTRCRMPLFFRQDGKKWPLDSFLMRRLEDKIGRKLDSDGIEWLVRNEVAGVKALAHMRALRRKKSAAREVVKAKRKKAEVLSHRAATFKRGVL